jgi:hypothetical protein
VGTGVKETKARLTSSDLNAIKKRQQDVLDAYKLEHPKPDSAKSAYGCENSIEKRCRCPCKGKFHGAKRKSVSRDDPHAAAFYCPCCGSRARLISRQAELERRLSNPSPKVRAALRALNPHAPKGKKGGSRKS